jgi:hypothetical protein
VTSCNPSSSVQPPETNLPTSSRETDWGTTLTSDDPSVTFRHSGWAHDRSRIRSALVEADAPPRSLARFDLCGSDAWVAVDPSDPNNLKVLTNHCHSRWCVPCARDRAATISANLKHYLGNRRHRLVTLTLKHSDQPLSDQLDKIYDCFRRLRTVRVWREHVSGGCAVLEVKHAYHRNEWHPHLHVIIEGTYLPHAELKAAWWKITRDSYIVDIRFLPTTDAVTRYITKYVTKPVPSNLVNRTTALVELVRALRHRRLVLTFGTWRGFRLTKPLDAITWQTLCPLDTLYDRCNAGEPEALAILSQLRRCVPDVDRLTNRSPP